MADLKDKRKSGRRRTLFGGVVFEGENAWECSISDISEQGAKVRIAAPLPPGGDVDLKINKLNDIRRCKVMWARDGHVGLAFVVKLDKTKGRMSEFFKLVENQ